jgi:hypothetical protein
MTSNKFPHTGSTFAGLALALAIVASTPSARANVYATNIKLNGSLAAISVAPGSSVSISYILNEPASDSVKVEILSGATVVRTITIASPNVGTARGVNTIAWDGKNQSGNNVPVGTYSVRITAKATGYSDWTQISNDSDPGNYVYEPTGLAINKNPNSIYYGRVFVGNSVLGPGSSFGDAVGILKLNADGSYADEGGFSTGGFSWGGDAFSPWKMAISGDDKLYVNHWSANGTVLAFDQVVSSTYLTVLRGDADNNPNGVANMSGPAVTGTGTGTQIWMADINYTTPAAGTGISRWNVTADGTCAPNDTGTRIVKALSGSDLNIYPYHVAVDGSGRIYTIQYRLNDGDTAPRVLRFPAYTGTLETTADWKIGSADNTMKGAIGIAVDPTATYVAVSFSVYFPSGTGSGGIAILHASDGSLVSRTVAPLHDTPVVEWDNVGNVYTCDNGDSFWRIYSPPGANQATTVAVPAIQVTSPTPPHITSISISGSTVTINFTGNASDPSTAFTLVSSGTVTGIFSPAAGASITGSAGSYQATVLTSGPAQFYRIKR